MKVINNNNPLFALVCGFEHSGTTLVSEILRQHPQLDSGFEGGFLLNNEPKEFLTTEPFYTNSKKGWGLKDEDFSYICNGDNWAEVYLRIRERAEVIKNKNVSLFDKTPRYMQKLPNVLERVPDIPCLVIVKDIRSVFWSSYKRAKMTMDEWHKKIFKRTCNHTLSYAKGWKEAIEKGLEKRILLIKYEELCLDQKTEVKKIFDFLGREFQESYLTFNNPKYNNVYGGDISTQYLTEYKGNLPEYICEEILELTSEYSDWLWPDQQTDKSRELLPSEASVQFKSKTSSSEENTQKQKSMASSADILNPSSDPTYNPEFLKVLFELNQVIADTNEPMEGSLCYGNNVTREQFEKSPPVEIPGAVLKRKNLITVTAKGKRFLEIGFNGGHSSLIALYHNPFLEVHSVDICMHSYTELAAKYLKQRFPGRFHFYKGDSREVLPALAVRQKNLKFDVIHVDGGHGASLCRTDISNSIRLAARPCTLILDDTRAKRILDVYKEYEDLGFLTTMPEFANLPIEVHRIALVVPNH